MLDRYKIFLIPIFSGLIFSHGISESDKTEIIQGSLIDYLYLGAKHMITGYDHILFLIGVIFFLTRYRDIVKFLKEQNSLTHGYANLIAWKSK